MSNHKLNQIKTKRIKTSIKENTLKKTKYTHLQAYEKLV